MVIGIDSSCFWLARSNIAVLSAAASFLKMKCLKHACANSIPFGPLVVVVEFLSVGSDVDVISHCTNGNAPKDPIGAC